MQHMLKKSLDLFQILYRMSSMNKEQALGLKAPAPPPQSYGVWPSLVLGTILGIVGYSLGATIESKTGTKPLMEQAIQKGYATWEIVDFSNGHTEFVWKNLPTLQPVANYDSN